MLYKLVDFEGREKGQLESEYSASSLMPLLKQGLETQWLDYEVLERNSAHKFYLYRYQDSDFRRIEFVGTVETKRQYKEIYDFVAEALPHVFMRREKINNVEVVV